MRKIYAHAVFTAGFVAILLFLGCESVDNLSPDSARIRSSSTFYKTKNVIIVVVDGPRFSETWGDPDKQFIPNLANNFGPLGVHYNWFYNHGPTYTSSGHTAITTGHYQLMQNDGTEFPTSPSIFQLYLNQTQTNPRSAQIITSKAKLSVLADCKDISWRGKYNPLINARDREDKSTYQVAVNTLIQDQPNLMLIHFRGPDVNGHANNWTEYLNSISETDGYVWDLWKFLQNQEAYKGKTTLFVTNDHGRHLDHIRDGFKSHGDNCEGCLHINLFTAGPDFNTGQVIDNQREIIDLAPTIAELMGFQIPDNQGTILTELFKNN